jgi:hypothetical protein
MNEHQLIRRGTVLGEDGQPAFVGPPFRIVGVGDLDGDGQVRTAIRPSSVSPSRLSGWERVRRCG